jgi:hypothetical protein
MNEIHHDQNGPTMLPESRRGGLHVVVIDNSFLTLLCQRSIVMIMKEDHH